MYMKKSILNLVSGLLLLASFTVSAQTKEQAAGQRKNLSEFRQEIQAVIKTDKGTLRGFDFGVPASTIKETETAQFVADGKDFMIYKVPLKDKEYAEVIFYLDEQKKVKGFGVEFIISESDYQLEENIVKEFESYFTGKYGKFKVNEKNDEVWDAGTYTVEMGDSSEGGNALEIEIEIFPKKFVKK
jgi:hypothetical protein